MAARWGSSTVSPMRDTPHVCSLKAAVGEYEPCPGEPCPFWGDDACAIAGLRADLRGTEGLAELLLRLRDELGGRAANNYGLLPPGLR